VLILKVHLTFQDPCCLSKCMKVTLQAYSRPCPDTRRKKLFPAVNDNVKKQSAVGLRNYGEESAGMTDAVITEYTGTRKGTLVRFYQYGNGGVRVLDGNKKLKRFYLFDPSMNTMTERDPVRQEKILRRFVFDAYGMLEETFAFGRRPRTFRFEDGARRIAVREGGDYGAVGKLFTFEESGVSETGWGRNGEIERVYVFEPGDDAITERSGGWFGDVDRTILLQGIRASVFREPEAFLQFLMFTEWSESDRENAVNEEVAKIRSGGDGSSGRGRYSYTGPRSAATGPGAAGSDPRPRTSARSSGDSGIDFIPDADSPGGTVPRGPAASARPSREISFDERRPPGRNDRERMPPGRSAEISIAERFEGARGKEPLSRGRSVDIPLEERFGSSREKEQLSRGGSVDIPLEERFSGAREKEELSRGRSVDIPLEERFGGSREKEQLSRGGSVDIPLEERFSGAREKEELSRGRSVDIPLEERFGGSREKEQLSRGGSVDIPLEDRFESARREREKLSKGKSADIPYSERRGGNR
jgi:hypothetical protein